MFIDSICFFLMIPSDLKRFRTNSERIRAILTVRAIRMDLNRFRMISWLPDSAPAPWPDIVARHRGPTLWPDMRPDIVARHGGPTLWAQHCGPTLWP